MSSTTPADRVAVDGHRPPAWLVIATGVLAATCLVLAVAETNLWAHYLIDTGEFVSLFGLAFILAAGLVLHRQGRLRPSLPLVAPWLLYPVITQGDQIIDNLSINPMRAICHVLLGALFGTPVAVAVMGARLMLSPRDGTRQAPAWTRLFPGLVPLAEGRRRLGVALLGSALLTLEMWVANVFLGTLMVVTLIIMILALLAWGSVESATAGAPRPATGSDRAALVMLVVGVVASLALYVGYKNRPGAYQGSPSFYLDPSQADTLYPIDRIPVPSRAAQRPSDPDAVRAALTAYADTIDELMVGYHILDRNYTWDFHNELFLRATPLVADYRRVGLAHIAAAAARRANADTLAARARTGLADDDPLAALLREMQTYADFNFNRVPSLERLSAGFEQTKAGLQHAAHLYEGENKMLTEQLGVLLAKHHAVLDDHAISIVTTDFAVKARRIAGAYANHVVGF